MNLNSVSKKHLKMQYLYATSLFKICLIRHPQKKRGGCIHVCLIQCPETPLQFLYRTQYTLLQPFNNSPYAVHNAQYTPLHPIPSPAALHTHCADATHNPSGCSKHLLPLRHICYTPANKLNPMTQQ
jgi:hypothetical protein